MQEIPFLYNNHFITNHVKNFINDLLSANDITIKKISSLTGVNRNLIKEIDKERLISEGKTEEARRFKRTKFILTSNQSTLERKDKEAEEGKTIGKESNLFNLKEQKTKGGKTDRLNELVDSNTLFQ